VCSSDLNGIRSAAADRIPFWLWPNVLALDAALVAVAWQHFFVKALGIRVIPPQQYFVLGLVVWVIYSADRIVDAVKLSKPETASHRHRFYRRHIRSMAAMTALGGALAVYGVLTMLPERIIMPGMALACLVVLYFVHRINVRGPLLLVFPKEVFSGFVFAFGTTLIGFTWTSEIPEAFASPAVLCFGALCALNCLGISVWEREEDAGNDPNAIAQMLPGSVHVFPKLAAFVALGLVGAAVVLRSTQAFPLLLASATGAVLITVLAFRAASLKPTTLRVLADVAVLLPALVYLPMAPWASTG